MKFRIYTIRTEDVILKSGCLGRAASKPDLPLKRIQGQYPDAYVQYEGETDSEEEAEKMMRRLKNIMKAKVSRYKVSKGSKKSEGQNGYVSFTFNESFNSFIVKLL